MTSSETRDARRHALTGCTNRKSQAIDASKYLSAEEVRKLRAAARAWRHESLLPNSASARGINVWLFLDIALATGLRIGEIVLLNIEDFDFDRGFARVPRLKKTHVSTSIIPIPKRTLERVQWLKDHFQRTSGPLLIGQRGPMTDWGMRTAFKELVRRAGVRDSISPHSTRHTVAVALTVSKGIKYAQQALCHSQIEMTSRFYGHIPFDDMRVAMEDLFDDDE